MTIENNKRFHALMLQSAYPESQNARYHSSQKIVGDEDLEEARKLIESGLDYTTPGEGPSIFEALLKNIGNTTQRLALFTPMLAQGHNPLNEAMPALDRLSRDEELLGVLEEWLATLETQGKPMRSANGGNLLHVMAAQLANVVGVIDDPAFRPERPHHTWRNAWLKETDADGNTPLHVLWGDEPRERVASDLTHVDKPEAIERVNLLRCEVAGHMIKREADFLATNHAGQTPLDLIRGNDLSFVSSKDRAKMSAFFILLDQLILEQDTAPAGKLARPKVRL